MKSHTQLSNRSRHRLGFHGAACLVVVTLAGCGSDSLGVNGKISCDGVPLADGLIVFVPQEPTPGSPAGSVIKDGHYSIDADKGLQVGGNYRVEITALRETGKTLRDVMQPGAPEVQLKENFLPAKYNSQSELHITATAASTTGLNFELESTATD